jgi:hypothetical protein
MAMRIAISAVGSAQCRSIVSLLEYRKRRSCTLIRRFLP